MSTNTSNRPEPPAQLPSSPGIMAMHRGSLTFLGGILSGIAASGVTYSATQSLLWALGAAVVAGLVCGFGIFHL